MSENQLMLLDCTLRDGGYVNDWNWGYDKACDIIKNLSKAGVDVVEVGFLRNVDSYNPDVTTCNTVEELNNLIRYGAERTMYSAMAMRSNYDIDKLTPYCGSGIEMIRITAHDYDIEEGMDFARRVKEKGYKLSINPINIMGYSDSKILWIVEQVNDIAPYQFSIVDTFGSMKRQDLNRIVSIVDHNLDRQIRLGLHLHENMSLSCSLAQDYLDKHLNRPITIDASLMGMGRTPGNLPIELIADYLNENNDKAYDIDYMMDAIQDYIAPIKGETEWGYTPAYFLSARFNLHRNYAEHYLKKGNLTNRDINHILSRVEDAKKTVYDAHYADELYEAYTNCIIDDSKARIRLKELLHTRDILLIAPGHTLVSHADIISNFISEVNPLIMSVNFIPDNIKADYAFFSNNRRYDKMQNRCNCKLIVTSNLKNVDADFIINHGSLTGAFDQGLNSLIMVIKLLKDMDVGRIYVAGADGYAKDKENYYSSSIRSYTEHDNSFNLAVTDAIRKIGVRVEYITPSAYEAVI